MLKRIGLIVLAAACVFALPERASAQRVVDVTGTPSEIVGNVYTRAITETIVNIEVGLPIVNQVLIDNGLPPTAGKSSGSSAPQEELRPLNSPLDNIPIRTIFPSIPLIGGASSRDVWMTERDAAPLRARPNAGWASCHAGEIRVLLGNALSAASDRLASWQQSLQEIALPAERIYSEQQPALEWIDHGN